MSKTEMRPATAQRPRSPCADPGARRELRFEWPVIRFPLASSGVPTNSEPTPFRFRDFRRWRWQVLAGLSVVTLVAWGAHVVGVREVMNQIVFRLREAGAPVFFTGMALLPAVGFPLLPFSLAAGPVFAPSLGAGGVIACAILAVAVNVALSYLLASTVLHSLTERLMARLGYRLPELPRDNAWFFLTFVRVVPALPFWVRRISTLTGEPEALRRST